jgi:hypothetical protein
VVEAGEEKRAANEKEGGVGIYGAGDGWVRVESGWRHRLVSHFSWISVTRRLCATCFARTLRLRQSCMPRHMCF